MDIIKLYIDGNSIPEVSKITGVPKSSLRYHLNKAGVLRSRTEALILSGSQGKLGKHLKGRKRNFTDEWRKNISVGKIKGADKWAKGKSLKPNGYIEITRGKDKFRGEHVVIIEKIIGRRLYINECVHHKDFDRSNNEPENLELMTRSEHLKLHRRLDIHKRKRDNKGRFE